MLSPLPPDPYAALGVPKDADLGQIRTAHRKLVLKYHPDRIKADNVDEKDRAKDEFQKAQQAYELLSDPSKRSRYDDQVKLAELQRERMTREAERPAQHHSRSAAPGPTTVRREMRTDGNIYEERAPPTSYFDSRDKFDDPIPRSPTARKHEAPYERERKPSASKPVEKKEKPGYRESSPIDNISFRTAAGLKAAAARVRERERTKEGHAKNQEARDREKRRERSEKQFPKRSAYVEVESESDSDTAVPQYTSRSRRPSPPPRPEPEPVRARPTPSRRDAYNYDDGPFSDDEKWEQLHRNTMNYLAESQKRQAPSRKDSNAYVYWEGDFGGRRSGSDNERKSTRRSKPDESRTRPTMPVYSSDPSHLRPNMEERTPQREKERERSKTHSQPSERERAMPSLPRAHTMPTNKTSKKDNVPAKGSNLKHSETQQDSGYYSSSSPHTPEMKGESPPPSRENSKKKNSTYKYQIVTPDSDDDSRVSRIQILENDDAKYRRYRSPEPERRDRDRERDRERERERERERDRDRDRERERERDRGDRPRERERPVRMDSSSRPQSNRGPVPASFSRSEFRQEIPAPPSRGSPPVRQGSGKLFREVTPDEKDNSYDYPYDANRVKTSSYQKPQYTSHSGRYREPDDDYPTPSSYKDPVRHTHYRRASPVY